MPVYILVWCILAFSGLVFADLVQDTIYPNLRWRWVVIVLFWFIGAGFIAILFFLDLKKEKTTKGERWSFYNSWILVFLLMILFLGRVYWTTEKPDSRSIPIAGATPSVQVLNVPFIPSANDNPTNAMSVETGGNENLVDYYDDHKTQPERVQVEAHDQLSPGQNHPFCAVFLYENELEFLTKNPDADQSLFVRKRPDFALALFKVGRTNDALKQLNAMLDDMKMARTNADSKQASILLVGPDHTIGNEVGDSFHDLKDYALRYNPNIMPLLKPIIIKYDVLSKDLGAP